MGITVPLVNRRTGQISDTRFRGYLKGGPELIAKLEELDRKARNVVAKAALSAAGRILADEWARLAPVGVPPHDTHPGAYRRSLQSADAVRARASGTGGTATVKPARLPDLADNQQPQAYAPVLEFRDARPAARPAFDSKKDEMVDAIGRSIAEQIR